MKNPLADALDFLAQVNVQRGADIHVYCGDDGRPDIYVVSDATFKEKVRKLLELDQAEISVRRGPDERDATS